MYLSVWYMIKVAKLMNILAIVLFSFIFLSNKLAQISSFLVFQQVWMLAIVSEKKRKKVELEAFSRMCLVSHTLHQVKVKQKKAFFGLSGFQIQFFLWKWERFLRINGLLYVLTNKFIRQFIIYVGKVYEDIHRRS